MNALKFYRYVPRIFFKRGLPLNLIFFVTAKCNARCLHCFFWREINNQEKQLSLPEIEKIAKSLRSLMAVSLTGGEPFLRDDLVQIALIFSRHTRVANLNMPTNGLLTGKIVHDVKEILGQCRPDLRVIVGVSLDDLGEAHDAARQVPGIWQKALETIKQLKELEKEFANFTVGSTITINRNNQERVGRLFDFLKNDFKLKEVSVNLIRSEVKEMSLKEVDVKYYDEINDKIREGFVKKISAQQKTALINRILSSRHRFGSRQLSQIYSQNRYLTPCYAGSLLAILRENGDVYPCEMLNMKMGNVRDFNFNFKKLWFSGQAQEVRQRIKKMKCFCTYECAMTLNTLFNFRHLLKIFKDAFKNG